MWYMSSLCDILLLLLIFFVFFNILWNSIFNTTSISLFIYYTVQLFLCAEKTRKNNKCKMFFQDISFSSTSAPREWKYSLLATTVSVLELRLEVNVGNVEMELIEEEA